MVPRRKSIPVNVGGVVIGGAAPEGTPASFRDGWIVQRVLDAVRAGVAAPLD